RQAQLSQHPEQRGLAVLAAEADAFGILEQAPQDEPLESPAPDERHGVEGQASILQGEVADREDPDEIGMVEAGGGLLFADEPFQGVIVRIEEDFDRDVPPELFVESPVDDPHPALADFLL